jgi:uncharacterized membrane protein YeaQ/YmgE (transglycosylase-associated protein family)
LGGLRPSKIYLGKTNHQPSPLVAPQFRCTVLCEQRRFAARFYAFIEEKHSMMSIIGTIIIGFIVGLIARAVKPGDDKLGLIMTSVLGIAGSFVATYVGSALGLYKQGDAAGFIASVVGAVILLVIYGLVTKKSGGGGSQG